MVPTRVVPAGGTLTYQGRPVADAKLTFHGTSPSDSAFAITDARGNFRCMTNDSGEGIAPGDYTVTVVKSKGGIPAIYADAESSPISVAVEETEENHFNLSLKDD